MDQDWISSSTIINTYEPLLTIIGNYLTSLAIICQHQLRSSIIGTIYHYRRSLSTIIKHYHYQAFSTIINHYLAAVLIITDQLSPALSIMSHYVPWSTVSCKSYLMLTSAAHVHQPSSQSTVTPVVDWYLFAVEHPWFIGVISYINIPHYPSLLISHVPNAWNPRSFNEFRLVWVLRTCYWYQPQRAVATRRCAVGSAGKTMAKNQIRGGNKYPPSIFWRELWGKLCRIRGKLPRIEEEYA